MPELPEVETMRRDLAAVAQDAAVVAVQVLDEKVIAGCARAFTRGLKGRRLVGFGRRGKVLIIRLDNGALLLGHPRMTGRLFALPLAESLTRFARVALDLDNGLRVVLDDIRRFGRLELVPATAAAEGLLLRNIGDDGLQCRPDHMRSLLARRSVPVKVALLDQKVVAGIGNIYASEILFHCGLDPRTPSRCIRPREADQIAAETCRVLGEGVRYRGTTIADYRTLDGNPGDYQKLLQVYGREGQRCLREGCGGTIRKTVLAGRSTYYCTHCQRTGRGRKVGEGGSR